MAAQTSLFAEKLRSWRVRNGTHGRMTQEDLALLLDVSVDAIGKYERSVSFIRGDLEHRLTDRLGWDLDEVRACREDWERRADRTSSARYHLLDDAQVGEHFGGSWLRAAQASLDLAELEFADLPPEFEPGGDVFLDFYSTQRNNWGAVLQGGRFVAKWSLPFLLPEDEQAFRAGTLVESNLSVGSFHRPILPGIYYGYCPALIVRPGHEAATTLLLSSFVRFLEDLTEREVLLRGMGTYSVSADGAQICRDLGMTNLGPHKRFPEFATWELPGSAIPGSIFGRRSAMLRRAYATEFGSAV